MQQACGHARNLRRNYIQCRRIRLRSAFHTAATSLNGLTGGSTCQDSRVQTSATGRPLPTKCSEQKVAAQKSNSVEKQTALNAPWSPLLKRESETPSPKSTDSDREGHCCAPTASSAFLSRAL